ncbi:DUF2971 domain-containing protein [Ancylobacter polymorphus]|uniref:DUF2971 domain-containing protein n=1 Tax=Ancylobacter polymorphus TaxID=223390 RepID=A0ABU0B6X2_9HYPH|nr:DUF2971 domain-containing protein [Ancylobacter polymorphus]MDQ0301339.1 hypothetical protein [Ancylobacter polymorphus]
MIIDSNYMALANVVFGYALSRMAELGKKDLKLAHYTSAENALNIINGDTVWLRNAGVMNDHSEIEHGRDILQAALDLPMLGGRLYALLDQAHFGLAQRIGDHVKRQRKQAREQIFMASLCETAANDRLGRLSMWRAYGGTTSGAALVFNGDVFASAELPLQSFASPVLYGDIDEFAQEFETLINRLDQAPALLSNVTADMAFRAVSSALDFAILSVKHRGFEEEREWRVIHRPFDQASQHVVKTVASIGGTPQLIYQMPLVSRPGMNISGLTLDRLLHRVIIGPSLHPETTWRALVESLRAKGVTSPEARVVISDIPLRQRG